MKNNIFKLFALIALVAFAACSDNDEQVKGISLSTETLQTYAHRSENPVNVYANESWVATTEVPWIQISPANGLGSAECKVIVDSTVVQSERDARVRFTFESGVTRYLSVTQSGYLPTIELQDSVVNLSNFGSLEERYFDINVYTNVRFDIGVVSLEEGSSTTWIRADNPEFNFDRGARPRNVKVRFRWDNNTIPLKDRSVKIKFNPSDATDYPYERKDSLLVIQEPGILIEDSRAGDSLAILAIQRGLGCWYMDDPSELLHNWSNVEVWKNTDEGVTREKLGRIKSASFIFFGTNEALPYEIRYLKHVESLDFFSNGNCDQRTLTTGDSFYYIKDNLKKLRISAYGLVDLDDSFASLSNLESLDLSNNNFKRVPDMINKQNFPNLKEFTMIAGNMEGKLDTDYIRFFTWDNLETLRFSVNNFWGSIPSEEQISSYYQQENQVAMPRYTAQDCIDELLPAEHEGKLKVLPNLTDLRLNANRLTGIIPEWTLYHPNLYHWGADGLVFNQDQETRDPNGVMPGFDNTPFNYNYYYEYYKDKYNNNDF